MPEPKPVDEVCRDHCQLLSCDDEHVCCWYRLLTGDPNAAQRRYITKRLKTKRRLTKAQYDSVYRREHREEKRAYDRERYLARKSLKTRG